MAVTEEHLRRWWRRSLFTRELAKKLDQLTFAWLVEAGRVVHVTTLSLHSNDIQTPPQLVISLHQGCHSTQSNPAMRPRDSESTCELVARKKLLPFSAVINKIKNSSSTTHCVVGAIFVSSSLLTVTIMDYLLTNACSCYSFTAPSHKLLVRLANEENMALTSRKLMIVV